MNDKVNGGKELLVTHYLERIDPESDFMKDLRHQKLLKKSFFEEYKIHCFNYILLLFESCNRILTTHAALSSPAQ